MSDIDTLFGGRKVDIVMRDGRAETVTVEQLPISKLQKLTEVFDDEAAFIELVCGNKPAGWADTVSLPSCEAIVDAAWEVNSDFFVRWLRRRMERQAKLFPEAAAAFRESVAKTAAGPTP